MDYTDLSVIIKRNMETPVKTSAGTRSVSSARERLLAAADELFYEEGIHTVGIDRIIEQAGVAKATLYSAFGNKDGLIRAYLQGRLADRQGRVNRALAGIESPRERILAVFDVLGRFCQDPRFHGCAFVNASAESSPGSAAVEVSDESRAWNHALFAGLAAEAGAEAPDQLARRLMQLYDGAVVAARMDRDPAAAALARSTAAVLVDAAVAAAST
jgi:AcrR family transcriptional regulator